MIDELFSSILDAAKQRPNMQPFNNDFTSLYSEVKQLCKEQESFFILPTIETSLKEMGIDYNRRDLLEVLHLLEEVGKLKRVGEIKVGGNDWALFLHVDS